MSIVRVPQTKGSVKRRKDGEPVLRGQMTHNAAGVPFERTVPMSRCRAMAFARAFRSRPDIADCRAVRDHHATKTTHGDKRYFVRFVRATSPVSLSPSLRDMQDVRAQRAVDQSAEMEFLPCPDRPGWYYTVHRYPDAEGLVGVYETHVSESCTCPDHAYRCAGTGLRCKHQLALAAFLTPVPAPEPRRETAEEKATRRARLQAEIGWLFG